MDASLVIVGSGIKLISHLTIESKAYIEQSDKVLYLVNEPVIKVWIKNINSNAESLDDLYSNYPLRKDSYLAITEYILKKLYDDKHVCVVLYGHPCIYATPALNAAIKAKQEGYFTKILPGISTEDCLFADLLIDPASHGCLSLEATDLLVRQRHIDVSCHVIIWQVSVIGMMGHVKAYDNNRGIRLLYHYLCKYYPISHELISYSASQYPGLEPKIVKFPLGQLEHIVFSRTSTLYLPPIQKKLCDKKILAQLEIDPQFG